MISSSQEWINQETTETDTSMSLKVALLSMLIPIWESKEIGVP